MRVSGYLFLCAPPWKTVLSTAAQMADAGFSEGDFDLRVKEHVRVSQVLTGDSVNNH